MPKIDRVGPLDLTVKAPRLPQAELAGVVFLPRSIDKVRASLPGGRLGRYHVFGVTQQMLDRLGIGLEEFTAAVAAANTDDDVGAFVRAHTTQEKIDAWIAYVERFQPHNGDRVAASASYPWLNERPDVIYILDVLEEDDKRFFSRAPEC